METGGDSRCRSRASERDLGGDVHQLEDACVQEGKASRLISGTEPGLLLHRYLLPVEML